MVNVIRFTRIRYLSGYRRLALEFAIFWDDKERKAIVMRIEPTQKDAGIGQASPSQHEASQHIPTPAGTDHVQLSVLSQAAAGLAPGRLDAIQSQVSSGSYEVNASEVSRRIVDFYLIPTE
jgi:anti-sigma28 factor (negative regulator of flagellin synthesis)